MSAPPAAMRPLAMQDVEHNPLGAAPPLSYTPPPPLPPPSQPRVDPMERFLAGPVGPWKRPVLDPSTAPTREALERLARGGSWKAVAAGSQLVLSGAAAGRGTQCLPLDEQLRIRFLRIAALVKLRQVPTAEREMSLLGDLTGDTWHYETHRPPSGTNDGPAEAGAAIKRGSMVPFEMLHFHALMPSYSGQHTTAIARILSLLQVLARRPWPEAALESTTGDPDLNNGEVLDLETRMRLQQQRRTLHLSLVNEYGACAEYPLAVAHLERLIEAEPHDQSPPGLGTAAGLADGTSFGRAELLSLLGRLLLQAGNIDAAEDAFNRLECLVADSDACMDVRMNRGCLLVAQGLYDAALNEFDAALHLSSGQNATAANNRATCLLYTGRLSEAIATLENLLRADPPRHATVAVVTNLGRLYQMKEGGDVAKAALNALLSAVGSEELDLTILHQAST